MTAIKLQISGLFFLLWSVAASAQPGYGLRIRQAEQDTAVPVARLSLTQQFPSRLECMQYVNRLPDLLKARGFITASIDSIRFDSLYADMVLYLGQPYFWAELKATGVDPLLLDAVGWREKNFAGQPIDFTRVQEWQERILQYLENNGHPFARVYLDSLQIEDEKVSASLRVQRGPAYRIDSIRVYGNARISNDYLQRYLDIPNASTYNKQKLLRISRKIRELGYIEEEKPADLTLLSTGSVLNLYLRQKKSSQVNVLVGFLPNNDQLSSRKLLLTGEANILLRNALGAGETLGLNWQQLQVRSPRLNFLYQHPFLFHTPLGLDFYFDIFKKDSSFVNIQLQLGAQYSLQTNQTGKLFIQKQQTIISQGGINAPLVIQTRRLPDVADVNTVNIGLDYEFNNTDYRLNPRKGYELRVITTIGTKKVRKNNEVLDLKDPGDPNFDFDALYDTVRLRTYQFRVRLAAARHFPISTTRSTVRLAVNGGMLQSGNIFRNELFQIGGYKLLRGFDEESQYLSHYAVGTLEYRYLVGQNSFFYALADGGWGRNSSLAVPVNYTYFGTGLGLAFETRAGIFNLAWAVGKRNDTELNLRQSKIHFGFVNYF